MTTFLQIDAPVNKGNSGGPTFDTGRQRDRRQHRDLLAVRRSVASAFAIPAETVKSVVAQLKEQGLGDAGWIGVQIQR